MVPKFSSKLPFQETDSMIHRCGSPHCLYFGLLDQSEERAASTGSCSNRERSRQVTTLDPST